MKISTKGRYGLRAIIDIALYSNGNKITLSSVAERQNISENYLEHIFAILRKMNMLRSIKGSKGGYIIADSVSKLTIGKILRSLEGDLSVSEDNKDENDLMDSFLKLYLWNKIDVTVNNIVDSITIDDLIKEYKIMNNYNSFIYYI